MCSSDLYVDANGDTQTIKNPSNEFGLYTNSYDEMYPGVIADHETLMQDIAKLFPDVYAETPSPPSTSDGGPLKVIMTVPKFYIKDKENN